MKTRTKRAEQKGAPLGALYFLRILPETTSSTVPQGFRSYSEFGRNDQMKITTPNENWTRKTPVEFCC